VVHVYTRKLMDNVVFMVSPSSARPSSIGSKYKEVRVGQQDRNFRAWITLPAVVKKNNPAVIIFRGIGESLSDWIWFQKMLADSGIVSASFDYGPPADTLKAKGSSRLKEVTDNVQDIIDSVRLLCGPSLNLFLLGHSVGNAIMLEMYPRINAPFVKGVILCNAFASIKAWSVYHHQLSPAAAFFLPDYYDNTRNIKAVVQPILMLHSKTDSVNYFTDALRIYMLARERQQPVRLIPFEGYGHNYIYGKDHVDYWAPILQFIETFPSYSGPHPI
jgi:alpha-beta hydrolase superfamily lysophospholipase